MSRMITPCVAIGLLLFAAMCTGQDCLDYSGYLHWTGMAVSGEPTAVAVQGDLAYAVQWQGELAIISMSDPYNPTVIGTTDGIHSFDGVDVSGEYAFVLQSVDGGAGLYVVRVADPALPEIISHMPMTGYPKAIAIMGERALIGTYDGSLVIMDVSDPHAPGFEAELFLGSSVFDIAVDGPYAYAVCGGTLAIVDMSAPSSPQLIATAPLQAQGTGIRVAGGLAYVTESAILGALGIHIFDVSNPLAPVSVGTAASPGNASGLALAGDHALVADGSRGLAVFSIADPSEPAYLGSFATIGQMTDVEVWGDYACVAAGDNGRFQVIDISSPEAAPGVGSVSVSGEAQKIAVAGDLGLVASRYTGLRVYDLADPSSPVLSGGYSTFDAMGLAVSGDVVYLAAGTAGLRVVSVSSPSSPVLLGSLSLAGRALGADIEGNLLCIAVNNAGMQVVDVSNPNAPVSLGLVGTPGRAMNVAVSGSLAFVADNTAGLQVIDISDPHNPFITGSFGFPTYSVALDVVVDGSIAYMACEWGGLYVIDVSEPSSPVMLAHMYTPGFARGVAVRGNTLYVADDGAGLLVVDVSHPANPVPVGSLSSPGDRAQSVALGATGTFVVSRTSMIGGSSRLQAAWLNCEPGSDVPWPAAGAELALRLSPNPFSPRTRVLLDLPGPGVAGVSVHDVRGRLVRTLWSGPVNAGLHQIIWDGMDDRGRPAVSGVYLVRLTTDAGQSGTAKATLAR